MAPGTSGRSWFGRRRRGEHEGPGRDTVDLREPQTSAVDGSADVLERLTRLRDAGLITNAEYEKERRSLLGVDGPS